MRIKKGDKVFLTAPGGYIKDASIIDKAMELLDSWGLKVEKGKHILKQQGHFSGKDEERASDLQYALDNPEIKLIWALRGGYGTNRILDRLRFDEFIKNPKIIAGFSDITLLHNMIQNLGFPAWHTFMPVNLSAPISKEVIEQTRKAFFGEEVSYYFPLSPYNKNAKKSVKGIITGGNLALLYSTLGTTWEVDTKNKILFIEDVGEQLYQIDRMMISMKKAGKLKHLKALLVGQFTDIPANNPAFHLNVEEIIREHTQEFDFPVFFDFPAGHIQNNYPIILGKEAMIENKNAFHSFTQKNQSIYLEK